MNCGHYLELIKIFNTCFDKDKISDIYLQLQSLISGGVVSVEVTVARVVMSVVVEMMGTSNLLLQVSRKTRLLLPLCDGQI